MAVSASRTEQGASSFVLDVRLLGRFVIAAGELSTATWPRPSARRLCQLVLISPGRRLSRDAACDALFPALRAEAATNALWKALSMARSVLAQLGGPAAGLLCADHNSIWAATDIALDVDLDAHEQALRAALRSSPGQSRDRALAEALSSGGVPLEDEPVAEWADRVRDRLEDLRQDARLELARDRSRGVGRSSPDEVQQAWQDCLDAAPTCEEAASALMRLHAAQNRRPQALAVYERCAGALGALGLRGSPALEELRPRAEGADYLDGRDRRVLADLASVRAVGERRLVSAVFVELSLGGSQADPEDLRELVGVGLARAISEAEAFGGTVVSVSGSGMSVLFGAPQSYEDDPERALRSAVRITTAAARSPDGDGPSGSSGSSGTSGVALSVRIGVETGPAVVGPVGSGDKTGYGAVGEVVGAAAALQSVARPGSVLVGPATRAATEGIFEWGPRQDVLLSPGSRALTGTYLVGPRPRSAAEAGRRALAAKAPLAGRGPELAVLTEAIRATVSSGRGQAVVVVAEPGLGKTRLVNECRKYFMGWVGAGSGRLPLWLEGRCASYASSTPYGAYQQLLCRFIGAQLEAGEAAVRPALETAVRAVLGKDDEVVPVLARMMGLPAGPGGARLARMGPAELQHEMFSAMRSVLRRLMERGPTVLALEDLHWCDPTSLRLSAELAKLASTGPLLVLLTRRPEPDPGVGELETELAASSARPLQVVELVPIQKPDERALARSLLGGEVSDEVVEMVCEGVDGNPLFLEERLASLLDSEAFQRDGAGWRLGGGDAVPLPEALERLIRSRTDRLGPAAREAIVAAAVLGEEVDGSALGAVSELDDEFDDAVSELVTAGLLVEARHEPAPSYRFRHALIQDAIYHGLLRSQRRQLHARAAWHLEASAANPMEELAAVLGRHFAAAGEGDRAIHYLELAGDHAAGIFANDEAIGLYRQVLSVIDGDGKAVGTAERVLGHLQITRAVAVCEKFAALLMLVDRFGEARALALDGLARTAVDDPLRAARLQHLLANIEWQDLRGDAGRDALDAAENLIGPCELDDDQERVDLWLGVQIVRCWFALRDNEIERVGSVLERVRPLFLARGRPVDLANFYQLLACQHIKERRYRVDAELVREHRLAVEAAEAVEGTTWYLGANPETARFSTMMNLGVALTWYGDLDEARRVHRQVLAMVERVGTPNGRSMALTELAITAWRQGDVELVRELAPQARAAAAAGPRTGHNWHYVAAAAAALEAWVALRDRRSEQVIALGTEALERWKSELKSYPLRCLALFPLASAYLDLGQTEKAVVAASQTLEPPQARLPDELEAAVQAACDAWDHVGPEQASGLLADAVKLARDLGYA